jgi:chromosome segregation ATPase
LKSFLLLDNLYRRARSRNKIPDDSEDDGDGDDSDQGGRSRTVESKGASTNGLNDFFKSKEKLTGKIGTPNSEASTVLVNNSSVRSLEQKVLELTVKADNYQKENQELYGKINDYTDDLFRAKREYNELKDKYEKFKREMELQQNDNKVKETMDKRVKSYDKNVIIK